MAIVLGSMTNDFINGEGHLDLVGVFTCYSLIMSLLLSASSLSSPSLLLSAVAVATAV